MQTLRLRNAVLYQHRIDVFHVGKTNQFVDRRIVADVAFLAGVLFPPLRRRHSEQSHIEHVRFIRIHITDLLRRKLRGDEVFFDGIGMNAVIDFCKLALCRPTELFLFFLFETLELFDEIQLEFGRDPACKLEGDVLMSIHAAVVSATGNGQADGARLFDPLLRRDHKGIEPGFIFNRIEFDTVKIGIVQLLPKPEKDDRILISQPAVHDKARIFGVFILGYIGKADEVARVDLLVADVYILDGDLIHDAFLLSLQM